MVQIRPPPPKKPCTQEAFFHNRSRYCLAPPSSKGRLLAVQWNHPEEARIDSFSERLASPHGTGDNFRNQPPCIESKSSLSVLWQFQWFWNCVLPENFRENHQGRLKPGLDQNKVSPGVWIFPFPPRVYQPAFIRDLEGNTGDISRWWEVRSWEVGVQLNFSTGSCPSLRSSNFGNQRTKASFVSQLKEAQTSVWTQRHIFTHILEFLKSEYILQSLLVSCSWP